MHTLLRDPPRRGPAHGRWVTVAWALEATTSPCQCCQFPNVAGCLTFIWGPIQAENSNCFNQERLAHTSPFILKNWKIYNQQKVTCEVYFCESASVATNITWPARGRGSGLSMREFPVDQYRQSRTNVLISTRAARSWQRIVYVGNVYFSP